MGNDYKAPPEEETDLPRTQQLEKLINAGTTNAKLEMLDADRVDEGVRIKMNATDRKSDKVTTIVYTTPGVDMAISEMASLAKLYAEAEIARAQETANDFPDKRS